MEKRECTLYTPLRWALLGMLLLPFLKPDGSVLTLGQPPQRALVPSLKWVYELPRLEFAGVSFVSGDPAVSLDGTVYVTWQCLLALDPQGGLKWEQDSAKPQDCLADRTPVVDPQGDIYGAGVPILAVRADGSTKWTREVVPYPSILSYSQDTIFTALLYRDPIALDAQSGSVKWGPIKLADHITPKPEGEYDLEVAPTLIQPDGTLLVAAALGEILGRNLPDDARGSLLQYTFSADGSLQRVVRLPLPRFAEPFLSLALTMGFKTFSAVPGTEGRLYITVRDHYFLDLSSYGQLPGAGTSLYALDAEGNILWDWIRRGELARTEPVLGADGTIYLGLSGQMHTLYALTHQGQIRWSFPLQDPKEYISGTPAVGADGVIYLPTAISVRSFRPISESYAGKIYALSSEGELLWTFETAGDIRSSPTLAQDGTLYFTTVGPCQWTGGGGETDCEGQVYALQTGSPGLADSPWPMFRGDPQHSGRVHVPAQSR